MEPLACYPEGRGPKRNQYLLSVASVALKPVGVVIAVLGLGYGCQGKVLMADRQVFSTCSANRCANRMMERLAGRV